MKKFLGVFLFLTFFLSGEGECISPPIDIEKKSQKYLFRYEVEIPPLSSRGRISLWIPYPAEDVYQKVLKFQKKSDWSVRITTEEKYGNKMIFAEGKTSLKPRRLAFEFEIERFLSDGIKKNELDSFTQPKVYLGPDRLIPIFPEIKTLARNEAKRGKKPSEKIRAFYDYIVKTMSYDKSGEGWGRGDAVWACQAKRGNCTDFHSLFIAMARSQKIPARFEIGVPIPADLKEGEIPGYHCWAEAYADDLERWIPIDATEAKKSGKIEDYFGKLPNNRILLSRGRDLVLSPAQKGEPLNYFIYPYAEVDGKEWVGIKKSFYFKKI